MGFVVKNKDRYDEMFSRYPDKFLKRFFQFHRLNPHIFDRFTEMATQMRGTGRKKYSADAIITALRWEYDLASKGDEFKVNNNFTSLYARLLIYRDETFRDFFEIRDQKRRDKE